MLVLLRDVFKRLCSDQKRDTMRTAGMLSALLKNAGVAKSAALVEAGWKRSDKFKEAIELLCKCAEEEQLRLERSRERFEKGECSVEEFCAALREEPLGIRDRSLVGNSGTAVEKR